MSNTLKIAIVAGEASGDLLGARLIAALQARCAGLSLDGIGGPQMQSMGLKSIYPMERLSVMGLVEPLRRLPELLKLRKTLLERFLADPPDLFIGIDSPDFNLPLARKLKQRGVKTAHLVSPSVWAWRPGRINKIGKSVDLMQCLFPFEPDYYHRQGVAAEYVGHPLATELDPDEDANAMRRQFDLPEGKRILALLPGSREAEVRTMGPLFVEVARCLQRSGLLDAAIIPAANASCYRLLAAMLPGGENFPIRLIEGDSRSAISAADVVLTASGTATLEAALLQRPMVVAHRMGALSWWLLSRLVTTEHVALPNILLGERRVPELLQEQASVHNVTQALEPLLASAQSRSAMTAPFAGLRDALSCDFGERVSAGLMHLARV